MRLYGSHVPPPARLRLPDHLAGAQRAVAAYDPDLRLRRSAEHRDRYILERRCRRRPAVNVAMRDVSDMHVQARDGYIHVASVHPALLARPWVIVQTLTEQGRDTWGAGGSGRVADELEYEMTWALETRRRRRYQQWLEASRETYDILARLGDGEGRTNRTRINNAGLTPAKES